jgi:ABC-type multidrug transport system ATPase subunit
MGSASASVRAPRWSPSTWRSRTGARSASSGATAPIVEEPRFHPRLTGRENLQVHAAARDASAHGRVDAALSRVGLLAENISVERVMPVSRSLEDEFLSMTTRLENAC